MHSIKTVSSNRKSAKTLKFEAHVMRIESSDPSEKGGLDSAESPT